MDYSRPGTYITDGKIIDLNKTAFNRNGRYRAYIASGIDSVSVKIKIKEL